MGGRELPCETHGRPRFSHPSDRHLVPHRAQRLCEWRPDRVWCSAAHERAHSAQVSVDSGSLSGLVPASHFTYKNSKNLFHSDVIVIYLHSSSFSCCRLCEPVSSPFSLVSTSNVMLLSFRMTNGHKSFKGHFEAIAEEGIKHLPYLNTNHSQHPFLAYVQIKWDNVYLWCLRTLLLPQIRLIRVITWEINV